MSNCHSYCWDIVKNVNKTTECNDMQFSNPFLPPTMEYGKHFKRKKKKKKINLFLDVFFITWQQKNLKSGQ